MDTRPRSSPVHHTTRAANDSSVMIVSGSAIRILRRSIGQSMNAVAPKSAAALPA